MQVWRLMALLGSCGLAGTAHAAFVEYSTTIAAQPVTFSTTFAVQKFDTSLGTLTGITLSLTSSIVGQLDIFNVLSSAQAFTNASAAIPVVVTAMTPDTTTVAATAVANLAAGVVNPGANSFGGLTASATNSTAVVVSNWAYYIGLGTSTANFTAATPGGTYTGNAAPGVFFGGSGTADGLFKIRYDYLLPGAVPLPNSAALMVVALLASGLYMRRKVNDSQHLR
jgi:hypothetical protein